MHQIARNFSQFVHNKKLAAFPTEKIIEILRDPDFHVESRWKVPVVCPPFFSFHLLCIDAV